MIKEGKGMDKKILVFMFAGLFLVLSCFGVFATTTLVSPAANGNYSTLIFNCTTDLTEPLNATLYYNASGGAATTALVTMVNDSASDTEFSNSSVNIATLNDSNTYNFTCAVDNSTDIEYSVSKTGVTIDQTAPSVNVSKILSISYSTQTRANGTFVLNVSVTDTINATTVFFNLTNSSGAQDAIIYAAREGTGNYWSNSTGFNISKYTEGSYMITVYANDSANNLNSTGNSETIYFDSISPSSVTITETSRGASSLTLSVAIVENIGIGSACTVNRGGASISGTGTTQTLTETGLGCSHTYSYIVTCTDYAGNSKASSSTSFTTSSCGSSTTTTTASQWTNTYIVQNSEFEAGYSKELSAKQRMRVSIGVESHYVGVKSLTSSSAVIEVSSDPIEATLNIGDEQKFDVDGDGFYDILVKLLGITNNKADVSVQKINEEVTTTSGTTTPTSGSETTTGTTTGGETSSAGEEGRSLIWLWVVIVLVIIGIGIWFFLNKKK